MNSNNHGDGGGRHGLSAAERLEIERLDIVRSQLQAEYVRLYFDHRYLCRQHEKVVRNARELERKHFKMDSRAYRKQWRKLYEEEIALQELGATVRQYAEDVRKHKEEVWLARERLIKNAVPH